MGLLGSAIAGAMLILLAGSLEATAQHRDVEIESVLSKLMEGRRIASLTQDANMVELTIGRLEPERRAKPDIRVVCARTGPDRAQIMVQDHVRLTDDRKAVDAGFCDRLFAAARQRFDDQKR